MEEYTNRSRHKDMKNQAWIESVQSRGSYETCSIRQQLRKWLLSALEVVLYAVRQRNDTFKG